MSKPVEIEVITELSGYKNPVHFRVKIDPHDPVTKCTVTSQAEPLYPDYWHLEAVGIGVCKPGDVYDRETGCRMALASAFRTFKDENIRKMIWEKYFEIFPIKNRKALENQPLMVTIKVSRWWNAPGFSARHFPGMFERAMLAGQFPASQNKPDPLKTGEFGIEQVPNA